MKTRLSKEQIDDAHRLASRSIARWERVQGHYNNRLRSHLIGRLGEIAAGELLSQTGLQTTCHFRDEHSERLCDIEVTLNGGGTRRIEVKTWAARYWADLGRCIAIDQFPVLQRKCDLILWCVLSEPVPIIEAVEYDMCVLDAGRWSTLEDVTKALQRWTGRPGMRQVHNYQLDETSLRPWEALIRNLRGEA